MRAVSCSLRSVVLSATSLADTVTSQAGALVPVIAGVPPKRRAASSHNLARWQRAHRALFVGWLSIDEPVLQNSGRIIPHILPVPLVPVLGLTFVVNENRQVVADFSGVAD